MQSAADAPSNSRAADEPAVSAGRLGRQLQHACSLVFKAGMLMCSLSSALVILHFRYRLPGSLSLLVQLMTRAQIVTCNSADVRVWRCRQPRRWVRL